MVSAFFRSLVQVVPILKKNILRLTSGLALVLGQHQAWRGSISEVLHNTLGLSTVSFS